MESSFQLMIVYMFYYVKFTALSIKTICRALSLSLLVLTKDISSLLRSAILNSSELQSILT